MRWLVLTLVILTAACGSGDGSTEPDDPEIEGQWNGPITTDVGSGSLALTLTETDGTVTGTYAPRTPRSR